MSKAPGAPQTDQPRQSTLNLLILGVSLLTLTILGAFLFFFNYSARNWQPHPTYTATFNATQALEATSVAQTLTPPATATTGPTETAVPPTLTLAATNAGVSPTPSGTVTALPSATNTPTSTANAPAAASATSTP